MSHYNNLNIMRLIAALFVIVTHSYALSGQQEGDLLFSITGGQLMFSSLGVDTFFIISGFLIFNSFKYRKSNLDYLWKRCLRIFPALFIVLSLTVIIGYFFSSSSFYDYFWMTGNVKTYILNNLSLYNLQPTMSDVFATNPLPGTINGSLWTLAYEFSLYFLVMLAAIGRFVPANLGRAITALIVALCAYISLEYKSDVDAKEFFWGLNLYYVIYFSSLFFFGSLLASLKFEQWKGLKWYCIVSGVMLIISIYFGCYAAASHILLPVFIMSLGYAHVPRVSIEYHRVGDLSYGVYIYGFVIQQALMNLFQFELSELMVTSLIISLLCGFLSWKVIESKAMHYKSVFEVFNNPSRVS